MVRMVTDVNDVRRDFLIGILSKVERSYMEVPEGFEQLFPRNVALLLLKTYMVKSKQHLSIGLIYIKQ
jgi:hypothetical protein